MSETPAAPVPTAVAGAIAPSENVEVLTSMLVKALIVCKRPGEVQTTKRILARRLAQWLDGYGVVASQDAVLRAFLTGETEGQHTIMEYWPQDLVQLFDVLDGELRTKYTSSHRKRAQAVRNVLNLLDQHP